MLEASLQGERAAKRTIISKAGQAVRELQRQLEEAMSGRQVNWTVLQNLSGMFREEIESIQSREEIEVLQKEIVRLEGLLGEQAAETEALYHVVRSELEVELRAAAAHENAVLAAANEEMREALERAQATENALRQALLAAGESRGAEAMLASVDEVERLQNAVNGLQVTLDAERRRASQMERWLREEIQALQEGDEARATELRDRRKNDDEQARAGTPTTLAARPNSKLGFRATSPSGAAVRREGRRPRALLAVVHKRQLEMYAFPEAPTR